MNPFRFLSFFLILSLSCGLCFSCMGGTKIAFIVKAPDEDWFMSEWENADKAAQKYGFTLIKKGAPTHKELMTVLEEVAKEGAKGVIICAPDTSKGSEIVAKTEELGLKLITVDDRLNNSKGQVMEDVAFLGISSYKIGKQVALSAVQEFHKTGLEKGQTALIKVTYDSLQTIKERTEGASDGLFEMISFPEENILTVEMPTFSYEGAYDSVAKALKKSAPFKNYIIVSGNDLAVLGAVQAAREFGIPASRMIAIGINGSSEAIDEFKKEGSTGFYGSIKLDSQKHGYETAVNMYKWLTTGEVPPLVTYTNGKLVTRDNYQSIIF